MPEPTQTQTAPTLALSQLLREHPHLPRVTWTVRSDSDTLHGANYTTEQPFELLRAYAEVLGGSIAPEPAAEYEVCGRIRRRHRLTTRWRDVPVIVTVAATVHTDALAAPRAGCTPAVAARKAATA